jgi:hypothetical protein
MLKTKKGKSPDSPRVKNYMQGEIYGVPDDIPPGVAKAFLKEKWAVEAEAETKIKDSGINKLRKNAKNKTRKDES